ncbi:polymorphic toxin-type HINT domain-containing protein, partial [Leptospira licerasiae]
VGEQAKIYLNQIAGNAFGDFAYINDDGKVVLRSCFVAGTLVWTKDGQRPIETIRVGDIVLSWDEESGESSYQKVHRISVDETELIYELSIGGENTIKTTWNHPFWVTNRAEWVKAKDLNPGDFVLLENSKEATISFVKYYDVKPTLVYNFEVEENHTYYVGSKGVLVHNQAPYGIADPNYGFVYAIQNCKGESACEDKVKEIYHISNEAQAKGAIAGGVTGLTILGLIALPEASLPMAIKFIDKFPRLASILGMAPSLSQVVNSVSQEAPIIRFGANANQEYHTFRHIVEAGMDKVVVQKAILENLNKIAPTMQAGGNATYHTIMVEGRSITYAAYRFLSGEINVGRITVP